ncbi:MAG: hypothetical protein NT154_28845, partial [Verrucomicrobia bacterium]|nr:hypothetical protein [Verrucomicrobiota bacterium]
DDGDLADHWKKLAEKSGWDTMIANSLEAAVKAARKHAPRIGFVFLDLMMPMREGDVANLKQLQEQRRRLVKPILRAHAKTELPEDEQAELHAKLTAIDTAWRDLIVEDGGLFFLEEAAAAGWLKLWKYAIFSATDQQKREPQLEARGIRKHGTYLGWFSKPIAPERIAELLKGHANT